MVSGAKDAMAGKAGTFLYARAHEGLSGKSRHSAHRATMPPRVDTFEVCRLLVRNLVAVRTARPVLRLREPAGACMSPMAMTPAVIGSSAKVRQAGPFLSDERPVRGFA